MLQNLWIIPRQIGGVDVFGFGWLLGIWAIVGGLMVARSVRRHGWTAPTFSSLQVAAIVAVFIAIVLPWLVEPQGLPIRGYGVMCLLAVVTGVALSLYRGRRYGVDTEMLLSLATWLIVSGIIGARLFYVIEYWDKFKKPTLVESLLAIVNITQGGLVVYGSLLAGGAALLYFVRKHHLPALALTDLVAPGVVLAVGLGRFGCFLNGCCYGGLSDLPWAVQFPVGSPAFVDQVQKGDLYLHGLRFAGLPGDPAIIESVEKGSPAEQGGLKAADEVIEINAVPVRSVEAAQWTLMSIYGEGTPLLIRTASSVQPVKWTIAAPGTTSRPVHPTQLYSLIDAVLLCLLVVAYEPYKRRDGELTALVLTIHPISRFLLEIIRVDEAPVMGTNLSISQTISLAILAGGICLWIYLFASRSSGWAWPKAAVAAGE